MITRISSGRSPVGAVYYNEQKVGKGEAERLAIRNFEGIRLPAQSLTAKMVADKLEDRADLNERIKLPTFHVSLAMAKGEQVAPHDLVAIADEYMRGMGYARQPYAVYQHHDTEHPHVHIVSVRVDETGRKIPDSFEREKSNALRQQIEKQFGLTIAEEAALRPLRELKPVVYGTDDLKSGISTVVQGVLKDFTFSTFSQYNQLLKIYNVQATEVVREGKTTGLKYTVIGPDGTQAGAAMKSSSLIGRPTRDTVERRINAGKKIKGDRVGNVRRVAEMIRTQSTGWDDFQQRLSKVGIEVLPHPGKDRNLFGISFIDTKQRAIYTGSELGKAFTAGSLKTYLGEAYQPPSIREVQEVTPSTEKNQMRQDQAHPDQPAQRVGRSNQENDVRQPDDQQTTGADITLMRQLLYALGEGSSLNESEYELKKMLKKSHKPRLS